MYNRYFPTPQGGHRRETVRTPEKSPAEPAPAPASPTREASGPSGPEPRRAPDPSVPAPGKFLPVGSTLDSLTGLLSRFFPGFDRGDLLVLFILLLLLSEGTRDASTVAMTLAIYLFLQ